METNNPSTKKSKPKWYIVLNKVMDIITMPMMLYFAYIIIKNQ